MDGSGVTQSRIQGAGFSSRGIRHGASEGSGPSGILGDPPHVEGRERVSMKVLGTSSDGGGDGRGFPFPPPVATHTRGRKGGSAGVQGLPGCP